MLRSMYSGISGMKVNQTKLDVIGNNIANVGTTSFKSSRARFSDMLTQNISDAMAPSANQGGKNASQVGLGVQLASIDKVMTQGMMQPTGRSLDIAIDGDGFFMVSRGPSVYGNQLQVNHRPGTHTITQQSMDGSNNEIMYSRDGSFILDREGNLLTADGYRVMGYSLTNDDNSMEATAKKPIPINTAGLDFRFGPGSQLNGYSVVLGEVGPNTVTSADLDKDHGLIILNGDFSTPGALSTDQIESAINKGLAANGISQQVFVSGKPINIQGLATDPAMGGSDATAPNTLSFAGFALQFSEGSALNGYKFEIGKMGAGTTLSAKVDNNVITVDADLVSKGAVNGEAIKNAINGALQAAKIDQTVISASGSPMTLANVSGQSDNSGVDAKKPTTKITESDGTTVATSLGGFTFNFGDGGKLNGYSIVFGNSAAGTTTDVTLDSSNNKITIDADLTKGADVLKNEIKNAFNAELQANGITTTKLESVDGNPDTGAIHNIVKIADGADKKAPKAVEIGGFTVNFPEGSAFNNYQIEISDVRSPGLNVTVTGNKIALAGDFITPNGVTAKDLADKLNDKLKGVMPAGGKITVTGSAKVYTGLTSNNVEGGEDLKTPKAVNAAGMEFEFTPGGSLNGYKIQIGKITAGTKTDAKIDTKNKTIIIDGDFVTSGATSAQQVQNALNKALQDKGINQAIKVKGNPSTISGTESGKTLGGTPVQSLSEDGVLNFVDGSGTLKAYDGELKTLKIPDKVRIPGSDEELRVKTYTIDKNGIITGVLEDGRVAALGQIAMASFKNPEGLTSLGKNLYSSSVNSGDAIIKSGIGTLGEDNSKGYGDNLQGMLEMSNVDLAEQFTDMIVTTRAFQASGKMITTGDEVLQDIINLKR